MSQPANLTAATAAVDPDRAVGRSYDSRYHGTSELRGGQCPRSGYYDQGRFGRMFRELPPLLAPADLLLKLGASGGPMDGGTTSDNHPDGLPAGFTFLGQFIDHDITFDPTSSLERQVDPEAIQNFRTPSLELDNVYGAGPGASPHLYRTDDRDLFLVDPAGAAPVDGNGNPQDPLDAELPRNRLGVALIGDPRNDENLIVSQLHLALLQFHNKVVEHVRAQQLTPPGRSTFEAAQQLVRWHYQWIVLKEFLPALVGQPMVDAVRRRRAFYTPRKEAFIPVEFAVAAHRFGHSMVRDGYRINANFAGPIFPDLGGGRRVPRTNLIEWRRFFSFGGQQPQSAKAFDVKLSGPLFQLPFVKRDAQGRPLPEDPGSLATRNLLRGVTFGLPSGQDVARAMRRDHNTLVQSDLLDAAESSLLSPGRDVIEGLQPIKVLEPGEIGNLPGKLENHTPLWFYILKESEVRASGRTLGPVGGRIVAEVLVGLLELDKQSFLNASPLWTPTLAGTDDFKMADLLEFAGMVRPEDGPPPSQPWQ